MLLVATSILSLFLPSQHPVSVAIGGLTSILYQIIIVKINCYQQKFISEALRIKLSKPIIYIPKTPLKYEKSAKGFEAHILPEICDIWINADKLSALSESQKKVASNAYTILKGFAKIGIISLVDEATGYQYDRERFELQKILKAYISEELLVWHN